MAINTIPIAGHGWKKISYTASGGVSIANDWKELYLVGTFGGNTNYNFTDHIIREEYDNRLGTQFNIIHGAYTSASDYHSMYFSLYPHPDISGLTVVKIPTWKFRGTEYVSSSTITVYVH